MINPAEDNRKKQCKPNKAKPNSNMSCTRYPLIIIYMYIYIYTIHPRAHMGVCNLDAALLWSV